MVQVNEPIGDDAVAAECFPSRDDSLNAELKSVSGALSARLPQAAQKIFERSQQRRVRAASWRVPNGKVSLPLSVYVDNPVVDPIPGHTYLVS